MSAAVATRAVRRARRARLAVAPIAALAVGATLALVPTGAATAEPAPENPSALVNTFIGSRGEGNTFPGATAPFGMTQVSPTTAWFSGYAYDDPTIYGFSTQNLSGAGCWEQGGVLPIQPTTGSVGPGATFDTGDAATFDYRSYGSGYTHEGEVGEAGYYRTMLTSFGGIDVETTATTRVGLQRYTFPATPEANLFLNVGQANGVAGRADAQMKIRSSSIEIGDDGVITGEAEAQGFCSGQGYTYTQYFALRVDGDVTGSGTWDARGAQAGRPAVANDAQGLAGAWLTLDTTTDRTVQVSTAISYTSVEGARRNLAAEGETADGALVPFDEVRERTQADWDAELSRIRVHGGSDDDRTVFYTALYHALTQPSIGTDVDGRYVGLDGREHVADGWEYYQYFSLWDTYRTQNQLLAAFWPERARDLGRSVLAIDAQAGWLPRWSYASYETNTMTGDPAGPYLADLWRYGAIDAEGDPGAVVLPAAETLAGEDVALDAATAYAAMVRNATELPPADSQFAGRSGNASFIADGFIRHEPGVAKKGMSDDRQRAGSATLEYAVGECAVAVVADDLGIEADARRHADRAGNWRNVWDPSVTHGGFTGFPRARVSPTQWSPSAPEASGSDSNGFEEGTPWQYQFSTMQDPEGFAAQVGGREQALERLDTFFETPGILDGSDGWLTHARSSWVTGALDYSGSKYNPNNEPDLHAPLYYSYLGEPAKASAVVRTAQRLFTNGPAGVTGNDDLGTMSAWYVLTSLGLYPGLPGTGELLVTSPRFERIEITLPDAPDLVIVADGASGDELQMVDGVSLGGDAVTRSHLTIEEVLAGGEVRVDLTSETTSPWGTGPGDAPVSRCSTVAQLRAAEGRVVGVEGLTGAVGTLTGAEAAVPADATARLDWEDGTSTAVAIGDGLARPLEVTTPVLAGPGERRGELVVTRADGGEIARTPFAYTVSLVSPFSDVATGDQFASDIIWAHDRGITRGWAESDGTATYRPLAPIARDVMAAFLFRLADESDYVEPAVSPFVDVATTDQFYREIAWLAERGISTGWERADGAREFRPLEPIARDAMAAFLYRLAGSSGDDGDGGGDAAGVSPFVDVAVTDRFATEMIWLHDTGIATGWEGNDGTRRYEPLRPIARDAMAAFLHRFDERERD
ncbi:GH92 family glycosyl hydrolase [Litorihabitans aurantiacus]|uniref:SLH domain-containing protein n=1 Tax=Litorihabitans aurantiacus TaxID=1930061 RepID=A0AA37XCE7_9MICO|nr:GH92 family glycosyl hydrolase [Litorihabitans aurantiacus]GMA30031.1 hypothetical protein GCM10025875_00230 [Litorihabitans aurantiacus]GMA33477.1 hypothetical protein GCM10025875_34690 [Litorihabitans aurantiacus]